MVVKWITRLNRYHLSFRSNVKIKHELECGRMPNVMATLPNIGDALCSTPQSFADAQYQSAMQERCQDAKPVEIS